MGMFPNQITVQFTKKSLTQQQFAPEADVNLILKKYSQTGSLVDPARVDQMMTPIFGDFSRPLTLQQSLDLIRESEEIFGQLPAGARKRFRDDPNQMLEFLADENNRLEAIKLGLVEPKPVADPTLVDKLGELIDVLRPEEPPEPVKPKKAQRAPLPT